MSDGPNEGGPAKAVGGELIIPVAALLFTGYYFSTIIDVPWTAQVSAFFVGTILTLLIVAYLVRVFLQWRRGEVSLGFGPVIAPVSFVPKRLGLLALTVAYILTVHLLGFTITTFLFLASAMLLLNEGRRKRLILGLAAVLAVGGWLLFVVAFDTRFPSGPFERLMSGLV